MAIGGLILGILCGLTAALLVVTTGAGGGAGGGAGWLLAFGAYAVFGSMGLMLALLSPDSRFRD